MDIEGERHEGKFILFDVTSTAPGQKRKRILDAMRGLAIILMVIDHALSALESIGLNNDIVEYSRLTFTRFSMPLFMVASGIVWGLYGLKFRRWIEVFALAVLLNAMMRLLWSDFNFPEILMVWALLAIAWKLIVRYPIITMIIGYTQMMYWQISWQGFQPGELAIFLGAGVILSKFSLDWIWRERRTTKFLEPLALVGRYPLTIYGGHLALLALLVAAANNQLTSLI